MDKIQVQDQYWELQTKPYHPRTEKSVKLTFQCPKKVDEQNRTCYVAQAVDAGQDSDEKILAKVAQ